MRLLLGATLAAGALAAQQAVPAASEPHHRPVYQDPRVRILDVHVESRGATQLHRHDTDYVWVALGDSRLRIAVPGQGETRLAAADGSVHFSRGPVSHIARNENDSVFHNVTVELLERQTTPRNVCGEVLEKEYFHCREAGAEWIGVNLQLQFETDQTRVGILRIEPNAAVTIPPETISPMLIALEGTEAESIIRANGAAAGSGSRRPLRTADMLRAPSDGICEIRNVGTSVARFLVVEFGGAGE